MNHAPPFNSDLQLERFTKENAALVLSWRNSEQVRANSLDDEPINYLDHLDFVEKLQRQNQRQFFIVRIKDVPVGVLNIYLDEKISSWGCYLASDTTKPRPGILPLMIGIAGVFAFDCLRCTELKSTVLASNQAPQKMNHYLGIEIIDSTIQQRRSGQEIQVLYYSLQQHQWPLTLKKIMRVLTTYHQTLLIDLQHNGCDAINDPAD